MRRSFPIPMFLLFSSLLLLTSCHENELDRTLDELDGIVENKKTYERNFKEKTDSLSSLLCHQATDNGRWEILNQLFNLYLPYNLDTAAILRNHMQTLAGNGCLNRQNMTLTKMKKITILLNRDMSAAYEELCAMDTTAMSNVTKASYYVCLYAIYKDFSTSKESETLRQAYSDSLSRLQKIRSTFPGHCIITKARLKAQILLDEGENKEAYDMLKPLYDSTTNCRDRGLLAYRISDVFKGIDRRKQEYWLAESAMNDLKVPVKNYLSLYDLSIMLMEDNDLKRACKYIQCTAEDMIRSKHNNRIYNASYEEGIINEAMILKTKSKNHGLFLAASFSLLFLLITGILLWKIILQHKKLEMSNCQTKESNKKLSILNGRLEFLNDKLNDANKIKDGYVSKYMNLTTQYIRKKEEYRHILRKLAKTNGMEAVMDKLREPSTVDPDYQEFYRIFDETFNSIFPDFFHKVNDLLISEAKFDLNRKKGMTTKMRILAAIRLGMTDSGKIARFLNYAPATVYTYRTKMRNETIIPRKEKEYVALIQNICL